MALVLEYALDAVVGRGAHLSFETKEDNRAVRLNSRNFVATSGDMIGFQSKPRATVTGTGTVYCGQLSASISTGIEAASMVGLHVDTYLRGTTGDLTGDVRGIQIEMVDDGSSSRTVAGKCVGLRFRSNISYAVTGLAVPISIEDNEGTTAWDAVMQLPGDTISSVTNGSTLNDIKETANAGWAKVIVGASDVRYIALYEAKA